MLKRGECGEGGEWRGSMKRGECEEGGHSMLRQIFNKKSKVRPKTPTASKVIP